MKPSRRSNTWSRGAGQTLTDIRCGSKLGARLAWRHGEDRYREGLRHFPRFLDGTGSLGLHVVTILEHQALFARLQSGAHRQEQPHCVNQWWPGE
jgi:hypothetical protein